ncbi:MAG: bacterioferritin, partial [Planctomycetales bacterium]|nr:bacterioferritin [Planctomycetales bacterium]
EQFEFDLQLESSGVKAYNDAVALAIQLKDGGSRDLMEKILVESEEHVDWLETQLNLINEVGLANYLQSQMGDHGEGH